jgi:hypothetical protein
MKVPPQVHAVSRARSRTVGCARANDRVAASAGDRPYLGKQLTSPATSVSLVYCGGGDPRLSYWSHCPWTDSYMCCELDPDGNKVTKCSCTDSGCECVPV